MPTAFTREVSSSIAAGERTHLERVPIDLERARTQHAAYRKALQAAGADLVVLPALDDFPDATFVEDTAIVLHGLVVITRPGALSRRGETAHITKALAPRCRLVFINAPGTIDGGDVIVAGRRILIGMSGRTNIEGAQQLAELARPLGYHVETAQLGGALHLKTALTFLSEDTVLANPNWIDITGLGVRRVLCVARNEPFGANALALGSRVIVSDAYPDTRVILEKAGFHTLGVDVRELHKAEAGITCMSVIV